MNIATIRPAVFIGSSGEGHRYALALQANLANDCDSNIWSQDVFEPGSTVVETLIDEAPGYDYAILIISPDDRTESRNATSTSPRDNVIFEAGLFMGVLGRRRTFIVFDETAHIKIPTNLAGITLIPYRPHHSGNLKSSLGPAALTIQTALSKQGVRERPRRTVTLAPTLNALHHVSLPVRNLKRSKSFYRNILRLEMIKRPKFKFKGVWFGLPGGQQLHLIENPDGSFMQEQKDLKEPAIDPRDCHFALQSHNWEQACHYLRSKKVPMLIDPLKMKLLQAYILDPDGHVIEIKGE